MRRLLGVELLEPRDVPATWGNPWPDTRLTISFAPDGTDIGGQASSLMRRLDSLAPRDVWQREMLRAFQAWSAIAGVEFGVVADGGQAFGTAGQPMGDSRFGDIRIGGGSFGPGVLAFSSPFDIAAGTWSGDLRVNLDAMKPGGPDLYTMFLQEAGHILGIGHSPDPGSVMFEEYGDPRAGLSAGDIAAVQALYGKRDKGPDGNETPATATNLGLLKDSGGVLALQAQGALDRAGDVDCYRFTAPTLTGAFTLTLQRRGTSLLTPRVTLYDSAGKLVGVAESRDPMGGDLVLTVSRLAPLASYTVKVEAAGDFATGAYSLRMESLPVVNSLLGGLLGTVREVGETLTENDLHLNDTLFTASALNLSGVLPTESRFEVAYKASISDSWDKDYYRLDVPTGAGPVLQVMAWGTSGSFVPKVTLLDGQGRAVAVTVLTREDGTTAFQLEGVKAGETYFLKVEAETKGKTGNYFLGADFRETATKLDAFASGTLGAAKSGTLVVKRAGLMHFVLSSEAGGAKVEVLDAGGKVLRSATAQAGQAASLTVDLRPGTYSVRVTPLAGSARFSLKGILLTDPIGPQAEDPAGDPSQPPPQSYPPPQPPPPPPPDATPEQRQEYQERYQQYMQAYQQWQQQQGQQQHQSYPPPQPPPPPPPDATPEQRQEYQERYQQWQEAYRQWQQQQYGYQWQWEQQTGGGPQPEEPPSGGYVPT
ncbi:MAG: matrixin family metalloprotease [Gemmataceae bacterium]|nr:matrixin family metalloprotease [Gemmataceae bacterium]